MNITDFHYYILNFIRLLPKLMNVYQCNAICNGLRFSPDRFFGKLLNPMRLKLYGDLCPIKAHLFSYNVKDNPFYPGCGGIESSFLSITLLGLSTAN